MSNFYGYFMILILLLLLLVVFKIVTIYELKRTKKAWDVKIKQAEKINLLIDSDKRCI